MGMRLVLVAVDGEAFRSALASENYFAAESLPGAGGVVDVDKMWQALSLLTTPAEGSVMERIDAVDPLDPILGGEEVGPDLGYGPIRVHRPENVVSVHAHLSARTDAQLRSRYDPAEWGSSEVYPFCWDEDSDDLWDEEIAPYLVAVRELYARSAAAGQSVVIELS